MSQISHKWHIYLFASSLLQVGKFYTQCRSLCKHFKNIYVITLTVQEGNNRQTEKISKHLGFKFVSNVTKVDEQSIHKSG